jgi:hypothetical protein
MALLPTGSLTSVLQNMQEYPFFPRDVITFLGKIIAETLGRELHQK